MGNKTDPMPLALGRFLGDHSIDPIPYLGYYPTLLNPQLKSPKRRTPPGMRGTPLGPGRILAKALLHCLWLMEEET